MPISTAYNNNGTEVCCLKIKLRGDKVVRVKDQLSKDWNGIKKLQIILSMNSLFSGMEARRIVSIADK